MRPHQDVVSDGSTIARFGGSPPGEADGRAPDRVDAETGASEGRHQLVGRAWRFVPHGRATTDQAHVNISHSRDDFQRVGDQVAAQTTFSSPKPLSP